jgi:hypothetical protein
MSLHDYEASRRLMATDPPFYALIMAAMRKADTDNVEALRRAFPDVYDELMARYWAPAGVLDGDNRVATEDAVSEAQPDSMVAIDVIEKIHYGRRLTLSNLEEHAASTLAEAGSLAALLDLAYEQEGFCEWMERRGDVQGQDRVARVLSEEELNE